MLIEKYLCTYWKYWSKKGRLNICFWI